ncbi:YiiX/YebB-like N1pC/P60 family cysteine hydrolase [Stratiformator vulcanicus]|uniref:Permuted papain-like amidase enzyme, YaeF/YiiX, C92 family n=1 Tax=Stratiformator vulcanicus TaxID=2527980 RepID=A0A517R5I0_9PLAN|nr:YiiX/YebB-like N1pC/P60 family cysteine hydrolase [Stratiformator vulcanicus]QDT39144.1 hypothetical protein Pan189_35470 [Stratiformator vulcanicus]
MRKSEFLSGVIAASLGIVISVGGIQTAAAHDSSLNATVQHDEITPHVVSSTELADSIESEPRTGTLIFTQGDCLAVKVFSASSFTHVAGLVVGDDGEVLVYESQNGVGVRKMPLRAYLRIQEGCDLSICRPARVMDVKQRVEFVEHLESQLGRPYLVRHHLTGNRAHGIHCAEYMTDALMSAKLLHARKPPKVSPASLRQGAIETGLYDAAQSVFVSEIEPVAVEGQNWCDQMWLDTVVCTKNCWKTIRSCVLCK